MTDKYILDEHGEPKAEPDLGTWAKWFGKTHERIVKQEMIGDTKVSTVFLGINHAFDEREPILWETMCFGGPHDQEMDRCGGSREQAEAMHQRMVRKVKAA